TQPPIAAAGNDIELTLPNSSAVLNGSGTDPDGGSIAGYSWSQESGPSTADLSGTSTPELTVSGLLAGSYVFRLTVTDDEGETAYDEATVTVSEAVSTSGIAINSGGPGFGFEGTQWAADTDFIGGNTFSNNIPIANTTNDQLYQTERYSTSGAVVYEIPVPNGNYAVDLHFAELYFGVLAGGGIGSRVFDIDIENGQGARSNYDITAESGGVATAIVERFSNISVSDGALSIALISVVENPKISG
ncbi:malectin domain-containing carbohydrate-binding protein, partial [Flagellimonas sp. DF-77]|uniref:malectin n=1 Tax=Flagellimonas algarum TaxID=3230298 RepID=UPI003393E222